MVGQIRSFSGETHDEDDEAAQVKTMTLTGDHGDSGKWRQTNNTRGTKEDVTGKSRREINRNAQRTKQE